MILGRIKRHLKEEPETTNALAGGLAGAFSAAVVCPLDVLKTRLQVAAASPAGARLAGGGVAGGLSAIARAEGARGLYRGLAPTLVALLPNWAVYFSVYERLKLALAARVRPEWAASPGVHMAAAAGAGACTMLITNPLWVVKTRLQTQGMGLRMGPPRAGGGAAAAAAAAAPYRGTLDALGRIAREEGARGLYSGLGPSLLGVAHVVIQFPLYEALKARLAARGGGGEGTGADALGWPELIVASAASKMVASTATYPHEVLRSRMHIAGSGAWRGLGATAAAVARAEGAAGFYRGCATNLLRTTPAAAVTFTSFELVSRALRRWAGADDEAARLEAARAARAARAAAAAAAAARVDAALLPPFASAAAAAAAAHDPRRLEAHLRRLGGDGDGGGGGGGGGEV